MEHRTSCLFSFQFYDNKGVNIRISLGIGDFVLGTNFPAPNTIFPVPSNVYKTFNTVGDIYTFVEKVRTKYSNLDNYGYIRSDKIVNFSSSNESINGYTGLTRLKISEVNMYFYSNTSDAIVTSVPASTVLNFATTDKETITPYDNTQQYKLVSSENKRFELSHTLSILVLGLDRYDLLKNPSASTANKQYNCTADIKGSTNYQYGVEEDIGFTLNGKEYAVTKSVTSENKNIQYNYIDTAESRRDNQQYSATKNASSVTIYRYDLDNDCTSTQQNVQYFLTEDISDTHQDAYILEDDTSSNYTTTQYNIIDDITTDTVPISYSIENDIKGTDVGVYILSSDVASNTVVRRYMLDDDVNGTHSQGAYYLQKDIDSVDQYAFILDNDLFCSQFGSVVVRGYYGS